MATVRQHLKTMHEGMVAHHKAMSACHMAACNKAMDYQKEFHEAAGAEHANMADWHSEQADACSKAMDSDLNKLQPLPTGFRRVAPTAPIAVPRAGGPPIQKPNVPEEFADLVKVSDDRDDE